jgi:hypothetical protein
MKIYELCRTRSTSDAKKERFQYMSITDRNKDSSRERNISEVMRLKCKVRGFHGSNYEECRLLGYKNPVLASQETHYVSTTEPSPLMLCNIWGFHGGNYKECLLLRYKNPGRTSQETHYVSATEPSKLMLFQIWGFHGGDYEEHRLLGYKLLVLTLH